VGRGFIWELIWATMAAFVLSVPDIRLGVSEAKAGIQAGIK